MPLWSILHRCQTLLFGNQHVSSWGPYNVLYSNALVFACGHAWPAGMEAHFVAGTCICPSRRSAVAVPLFCKRRTVRFFLNSLPPVFFSRIGSVLRRDLGPQCLRWFTDRWCLIISVALCWSYRDIFRFWNICCPLHQTTTTILFRFSLSHSNKQAYMGVNTRNKLMSSCIFCSLFLLQR